VSAAPAGVRTNESGRSACGIEGVKSNANRRPCRWCAGKNLGVLRLTITRLGLAVLAGVAGAGGPAARAQSAAHGVAAANLAVVQHDISNNTASVTVTATLAVNEFAVRDGSNRGDYNVQIGPGFSDDVAGGVLLTSVAQNGRDNAETNYPGLNYCTSAADYSRSGANAGAFYIPTFTAPAGDEYNVNVSAAFFPYANWLCGYARNSGATNGGANDLFTGSPGLDLGTHFVDNGGGVSILNLTNLGVDARTHGVLLVTHGRNEDNYALSQVNSNNGTWTVFIKDNGTDAGSYEQDPVAFVFVPKTNTSVISGRFRGDGTRLIYSGVTPQFSVTNTGTGNWRLTIPGHSPASGVLIISAEGGLSQNQDNILSYQPDGDGWIIQSRDLPASPPGLQTPGAGLEPVAGFVFIPAAATAALIAPPDNAQGQPAFPTLQVGVTNAAPGNLTVKFYGRVGAANTAADFTIAALPDTQFYVSSLNGGVPGMFYAQAEWIVTNRVPRNIAYVAQLGDITQNGDLIGGNANTTEWRNATNAMYRLENPARTLLAEGIPYGVAVGNHDQEPIGTADGTATFYNQYFGVPHFTGRSYYAGHYGANNDNHFDFFSAGGMEFVVLYFEYDEDATPDVLAWGNEVLRTNAHRRGLVVTHNLGNTQTPVNFSAQGAAIYDALKTNANLFLMLAGHVTGEGSRVDTYNGNLVRTFVSDYQGWTNGGNGYLRIMEFSPSNNLVVVQTYSPWTGEYQTGEDSEFFFSYNMQQPMGTNAAPFNLIGTVSNVPPGDIASLVWPGLESNTAYEWYVSITDALNNMATGPMWRFVTAPNLAPVATNQLLTVAADAPTVVALTAYDFNGDDLTFETNTLPQRGVMLDFNPADGTLTYLPAHGFRGLDRFTWRASDGALFSAFVTMNLNVVAPPDTNANGLPDAWEAAYGITNPDADDDGDGLNNRAEFTANTNPTNAASTLQIISVTRAANGHVTLVWSSVGGTRYRVQFRDGDPNGNFTDIVRPANVEMDPSPSDAAGTQSFVDDFTLTGGAPADQARHYRINVVQ